MNEGLCRGRTDEREGMEVESEVIRMKKLCHVLLSGLKLYRKCATVALKL